MTTPKPVVLTILDGWGLRDDAAFNAPKLARTPTMDRLYETCPNATLVTFGPDVGLPTWQMGNSEVGHTNIGAGRVVAMDLGQIDLAIEDGSFFDNEAIKAFAATVKDAKGTAHLMGVVSDGGVHGHIEHIKAAVKMVTDLGCKVVVHAITDGRDVAPKSGEAFVKALKDSLPEGARIGTVIGRYYAMDRDNRWERVEQAYDAMILGKGESAPDPVTAVSQSYAKDKTDEFIPATVIDGYEGLKAGDGFFCMNFRADRAREILKAIGEPGFDGFERDKPELSALLGMVEYSDAHNAYMATAYPKRVIVNTIGEWVAKHKLRQFRLAETEKYPHVTFFLNGGKEEPEVDHGLGRVVAALEKVGGAMLVIADHGNCETMWDEATNGPHTAHTTNLVPVILYGGPEGAKVHHGRLADVAPTLLQLMNLEQPEEMTGQSLIDL